MAADMRPVPAFRRVLVMTGLLSCMGGCEGGNSSETVGFEPGCVIVTPGNARVEGRADAGNWVSLYAAGYLPHADSGFADTAWADSQGRFAFAEVPAGRYNIVARAAQGGKSAFLGGIGVPGPFPTITRRRALGEPGGLSGMIGDTLPSGSPLAYLPGTPFSTLGDSLGRYSFTGIPAGEYRVVKTWIRFLPCDTGKVCGGTEYRRDSAKVRIEAGTKAGW